MEDGKRERIEVRGGGEGGDGRKSGKRGRDLEGSKAVSAALAAGQWMREDWQLMRGNWKGED